jgi:hypothetical protein
MGHTPFEVYFFFQPLDPYEILVVIPTSFISYHQKEQDKVSYFMKNLAKVHSRVHPSMDIGQVQGIA